jgi:hypothetical protein
MKLTFFGKDDKIIEFRESELISNFNETLFMNIKAFVESYGYKVEKVSSMDNIILCKNSCFPFYFWKFHSGVKFIEYKIIKDNGKVRIHSVLDFYGSWLTFMAMLFYLPVAILVDISLILTIPFTLLVVMSFWKISFIKRFRSIPILKPNYTIFNNEMDQIQTHYSENTCPACGSKIIKDDKECPDCGITILDENI